jgi:transposase
MKRFLVGSDRGQSTLLPECLDDWIDEGNPVRAVDAFVDALDLAHLGFEGIVPKATGRPSYHPSALLKLYIYGYLNRVQSSRRLEREAGRNLEVIWLLGRLVPDDKTIADFRKDNGSAVRKVCAQFVVLCRDMGLLSKASVAIDGSKFKAVNNRDRNFTRAKVERRRTQLEESVARYLSQLDTADLQEPSEALAAKTAHLKEKLAKLESEMQRLAAMEKQMLASPDQQISLTDPDSRSMATSGRGSGVVGYNHHAPWRRGCDVAAAGAGAAREAPDLRILRCGHSIGLGLVGRSICATDARTRLDRGAHRRLRVSLGRGTQ